MLAIASDGVQWNIYRPKLLAPHDLRRSCARLCYSAGGELEQIQFLLGHVSVQTTEKYLGCKQRLNEAVNDRIGIEPCIDRLSWHDLPPGWYDFPSFGNSNRIRARLF